MQHTLFSSHHPVHHSVESLPSHVPLGLRRQKAQTEVVYLFLTWVVKHFFFLHPWLTLLQGTQGAPPAARGEEQVLLVYKSLCYTPWSRVLALNHRTLGFLSLPSVQSTLSWLYEALCLAMCKQISGYLLLDNVFWEQLTSFTATTI